MKTNLLLAMTTSRSARPVQRWSDRNTTQALKKLDASGDGILSDEELRPPHRDGAGSPVPHPKQS